MKLDLTCHSPDVRSLALPQACAPGQGPRAGRAGADVARRPGRGRAAGTALLAVLDADGATKVVETWRMYGLVVFTGLFVLLMLRSHHYRGVWELVIASKLAMTFTAVGYAFMLAARSRIRRTW